MSPRAAHDQFAFEDSCRRVVSFGEAFLPVRRIRLVISNLTDCTDRSIQNAMKASRRRLNYLKEREFVYFRVLGQNPLQVLDTDYQILMRNLFPERYLPGWGRTALVGSD